MEILIILQLHHVSFHLFIALDSIVSLQVEWKLVY